MTINDRWEKGIPHHPEAVRLLKAAAKLDTDLEVDLRFGGDGDNGETLCYMLSEVMERDERARTYWHYKGGKYVLLHQARDTNLKHQVMVYRNQSGEVFARPKSEWEEEVIWPDGASRPRFIRVGSNHKAKT